MGKGCTETVNVEDIADSYFLLSLPIMLIITVNNCNKSSLTFSIHTQTVINFKNENRFQIATVCVNGEQLFPDTKHKPE